MKPGWFIAGAGLLGALAGVAGFVLARIVVQDQLIAIVTGGLLAVLVPIIQVLVFYPRLIAGRGPKDDPKAK